MRRKAAILLLALMPLMLGSCSIEGIEPEQEPALDCSNINGTDAQECHIPLSDGRHVTCILYDEWSEAAVDCDWAHVEGADENSPDDIRRNRRGVLRHHDGGHHVLLDLRSREHRRAPRNHTDDHVVRVIITSLIGIGASEEE